MKKWYSLIPDGSIDYAIRNNKTGEIEAIIAKLNDPDCRHIRYRRFVRGASGEWEPARFACGFTSLKQVRAYYDKIHA